MTWKGEPVAGDVVVTAQPGVLDHARGHFIGYVEGVEHLGAVAPLDAGTLELRYLSAGTVAARRTLTVTPNPATLKVIDDAVFVGSVFHVVWTGPNGPKDYVIIVPGEASEGASGTYTYTSAGWPLTIDVPTDPGAYEIRYQSARQRGGAGPQAAVRPLTAAFPGTLTGR